MRRSVSAPTNIFIGRSDTFLGVCEAIGQDFGFNSNWLRVAIGVGILFQPMMVVAVYIGLAVVVFATRMLFPAPKSSAQPSPAIVAKPLMSAPATADREDEPLALAA